MTTPIRKSMVLAIALLAGCSQSDDGTTGPTGPRNHDADIDTEATAQASMTFYGEQYDLPHAVGFRWESRIGEPTVDSCVLLTTEPVADELKQALVDNEQHEFLDAPYRPGLAVPYLLFRFRGGQIVEVEASAHGNQSAISMSGDDPNAVRVKHTLSAANGQIQGKASFSGGNLPMLTAFECQFDAKHFPD